MRGGGSIWGWPRRRTFRTVCSISKRVFAPRLEAQHPLAAPQDKADEAKTRDQDDPHFRPHPRRKGARARDHAVNTFAKAVPARRQRLFVLPGEDQSLFGWWRNDYVVGLFNRKTAIIDVVRSRHGLREQQAGGGKNAEARGQGPHHRPHIRLWRRSVNDIGPSAKRL
jgi:hypothetical protein